MRKKASERANYQKQYTKEHTRRISLCLSLEKDKDIIEAIEKKDSGNLQNGVRLLIREAIGNK